MLLCINYLLLLSEDASVCQLIPSMSEDTAMRQLLLLLSENASLCQLFTTAE
jgi:hypothetical protein